VDQTYVRMAKLSARRRVLGKSPLEG